MVWDATKRGVFTGALVGFFVLMGLVAVTSTMDGPPYSDDVFLVVVTAPIAVVVGAAVGAILGCLAGVGAQGGMRPIPLALTLTAVVVGGWVTLYRTVYGWPLLVALSLVTFTAALLQLRRLDVPSSGPKG